MKKIIGLFLVALIPLYVSAGPDNIAPAAKVKASSSVPGYECQHVTDGIICIQDQGEWASNSSVSFYGSIDYPWIELEWDTPRSIDRIHLYDRPSQQIHTAGITIHFDDGSRLPVNTIPNDGTAKVVEFAPKTTKRLRFEVTDGDGPTLGLSEIEVFPSPQDYPDYVSYVDPYIESARGRYFFFVTGSRPFGMFSAAPMTRNKNQYGGGYNYNSTEILGFPQVHCWMLSGITLMPATGDIDPTKGEQGWKSRFSHNEELVQPGYHRVFLNDYKLWVEQTCTDRVGFYRMKYTEDCLSNTLLNLGGFTGTSTMTDAEVRQTGPAELEGSVSTVGRLWGGPEEVKIYFVMHFDKPFDRLDSWDDSLTTKAVTGLKVNSQATPRNAGMTYYDAPTAGIQALHRLKKGEELQVKIAISYTNIENARHNLAHECAHWDFDAIRRDQVFDTGVWLGFQQVVILVLGAENLGCVVRGVLVQSIEADERQLDGRSDKGAECRLVEGRFSKCFYRVSHARKDAFGCIEQRAVEVEDHAAVCFLIHRVLVLLCKIACTVSRSAGVSTESVYPQMGRNRIVFPYSRKRSKSTPSICSRMPGLLWQKKSSDSRV